VLFFATAPSDSTFMYHRIGWDLSTSGVVSSWSAAVLAPWSALFGFGVGLDIGDIDGNAIPDMVVGYRDGDCIGCGDKRIRIGWDISSSGEPAGWSREFYVAKFGSDGFRSSGIGLAAHQFGTNPRLGMAFIGLHPILNNDEVRYWWA
jgi:hypothetical protein